MSKDTTAGAFLVDRVGSDGSDLLATGAEGEGLFGLAGDDVLSSIFNHTVLFGGSGRDRLRTEADIFFEGLARGVATGEQRGGSGDDWMTFDLLGLHWEAGVSIEASLYGGEGNDEIEAEMTVDGWGASEGNLFICGGAGDDRISTDADSQYLYCDTATVVDGGEGRDTITALAGASGGGGLSRITVYGGSGGDFISAESRSAADSGVVASNRLFGGEGDDRIAAYAEGNTNIGDSDARSVLDGGAGDDDLTAVAEDIGGNGTANMTNALDGGDGQDALRASIESTTPFTRERTYTVNATNTLGGGLGDDTLTATIDIDVQGGYLSTTFLYGGGGDDALRASAKAAFVYDPYGPTWSLNVLSGGDGDDALTGETGGPGRSKLYGGAGADTLTVIGGNRNVLEGGAGADVSIGGSGIDDFVFDLEDLGSAGPDVVAEFDATKDRLAFSGLGDVGASGLVDDLDAFATFEDAGSDLHVRSRETGNVALVLKGFGGLRVDSVADVVSDPARQLVLAEEVFA